MHAARDSIANGPKITERPRIEAGLQLDAFASRQRGRDLRVQKQPAAVLMRGRPVYARQPSKKVCVALVGQTGKVAPFVRNDERTLEWQQILCDECFEKIWIRHPV